jgi:hypothetical protein
MGVSGHDSSCQEASNPGQRGIHINIMTLTAYKYKFMTRCVHMHELILINYSWIFRNLIARNANWNVRGFFFPTLFVV